MENFYFLYCCVFFSENVIYTHRYYSNLNERIQWILRKRKISLSFFIAFLNEHKKRFYSSFWVFLLYFVVHILIVWVECRIKFVLHASHMIHMTRCDWVTKCAMFVFLFITNSKYSRTITYIFFFVK